MVAEKNYEFLLELRKDVMMIAQRPALAVFLKDKIDSFYNANAETLEVAQGTVNHLLEKHVQKDEKGQYISLSKGPYNGWLYKSPEDKKAFEVGLANLLAEPCKIYL